MLHEPNRQDPSSAAEPGGVLSHLAHVEGGDPHLSVGYYAPLRRTLDAVRLNEIANHPDVRPHIGGEGVLDLAPVICDPRNYALELDGGGFVIQQLETGIYEVHSLFLKEARRYTVAAMQDGMRFMFCETDCFRLVTRVPKNNPPARALAHKGGFSTWFEMNSDEYMSLDLDTWAAKATNCDVEGEYFHEMLEGEKLRTGSQNPIHADDVIHDRFVGVAIAMCRAGNPGKGIGLYNRWARLAGYLPAQIVSMQPLLVDIGDALLSLDNSGLRVLLCR